MAKGTHSLFPFQLLQLRMSGNNFFLNESSQNVTTSLMDRWFIFKTQESSEVKKMWCALCILQHGFLEKLISMRLQCS